MKSDLKDIKAGDKVFYFDSSNNKYPRVIEVTRTTENFVFLTFGIGNTYEKKFRRNGSTVEQYDYATIRTIEPGEIENIEKEKSDDKRLNEILDILSKKGFLFKGYSSWYSIEKWEKILAAVKE